MSAEYGNESPANDLYVANVIANTSIKIAGEQVDTSAPEQDRRSADGPGE